MKRALFFLIAAALTFTMSAQTPKNVKYVYTEASDLNLIGKILEDTPNPYHRVDTVKFKGFTRSENNQVRCSAGLAVLFKTNSSSIAIKADYGFTHDNLTTTTLAEKGFDLYIKKDGRWLYADSDRHPNGKFDQPLVLIKNMDDSMKECMLYLPMYSELYSCQIGVEEGKVIEAIESPFRHRIGIFGSSYTQGISVSRAGMTYPMQFMRNTGLQILGLGCSGNSKLQPYFAEVLKAADVDAIIFDSFSNPSAKMIEERLFPFIESIQESHPDIPLIFQQTIYRESRNFDQYEEKKEAAKMEMAEKLMKEACKKYKNVYFIVPDAVDWDSRDTSVDTVHPDNYGYTLWAKSIEKPVLKILKKYGIK